MKRIAAVISTLACTAIASCSPATEPPPPSPPQWKTVLDKELDRAVLSVWGTGPSDVFAVGGPLGNTGFETLALHYDGASWHDLRPGGAETFWWVNGSSPTDVWMVGTAGRIAHWNGKSFASFASGTTATLWGAWAFSETDAWVVGGSPGLGTKAPNDLILHFDGAAWKQETLPGAPLGRSLFKVWGGSSNDLYVVGEAGTIWHRKGVDWTLESKVQPVATDTLFTVHGCSAKEVYAVGGRDVLRSDGTTWTKLPVDLSSGVNGVSCASPGEVALAGFGGSKQRLVAGKWIDEFTIAPFVDLHAAWGDPADHSFWVVGGDFLTDASPGKARRGVIARYGAGDVANGPIR